MHRPQAHERARTPAADVLLAAIVPIALEAIDVLELRILSCSCLERRTVLGKARLGHLDLLAWVHYARQRKVVGRDHHAASRRNRSSRVLHKRTDAVREPRMGVRVDDRTGRQRLDHARSRFLYQSSGIARSLSKSRPAWRAIRKRVARNRATLQDTADCSTPHGPSHPRTQSAGTSRYRATRTQHNPRAGRQRSGASRPLPPDLLQ